MDGMRNLAIMESMSLGISWQLLQRIFFIIGLATMPIMTGKFKFPIAGNHIGLLFFTAGILIWGIEMYYTRKKLTTGEKKGFLFLGVMLIWALFCTVTGVFLYPSFAKMNLNQMANFRNLYYNLVNENFVYVSELDFIKGFLLYRGIKNAAVSVLSTYFISLWVYHIYQRNWKRGFKDLLWALTGAGFFLISYSIIEVGFLRGNYFCKQILMIINSRIFDVAGSQGWWPPLFWDYLQLRSLFPEPSHLGIFLGMAIPPFVPVFFKRKNKIYLIYLLVYFCYVIMLFMSKARTGTVVFCVEFAMFLTWSLLYKKMITRKQLISLLYVTLGAFLISFAIMSGFRSIDTKVKDRNDVTSVSSYIQNNITSAVGNQRSNSVRKVNTLATLKVGLGHPLMGNGIYMTNEYIEEQIPQEDRRGEIALWIDYMTKEGPIHSGFPDINHYATVFAEQGIIGEVLFLSPLGTVCTLLCRKRYMLKDVEFVALFVSFSGLSIALCANYDHIWLFIITGLLFSSLSSGKDRKKYDR